MRAAVAALAALGSAAALAQGGAEAGPPTPAPGWVSCRDRRALPAAPAARAPPARPALAEAEARGELEASVRRWEEEAHAFRAEARARVQERFDERRRFLAGDYEDAIRDLEVLERNERESTIVRLEEFLARYPADPAFTPDATFRLAELYYERANDDFELAVAAWRETARRAVAAGRDAPPEPLKSYAPSIALYQTLITGFPGYRLADAAQYLLAYCLGEMGQGEEAQAAFRALVERYPRSAFVPEAWVRLGDWWFDAVEAGALPRAAEAFAHLQEYPGHPLLARALYKLGWTYYRMDDFDHAVEAFGKLLDHELAAAGGGRPRGELWPEAIQYAANSLSDPGWGGVERARAWFAAIGPRPWQAELLALLGDVYLEETRYGPAVAAYEEAIARAPASPEAPRLQARIVLAWSRDRQADREVQERERLVATYAEGTAWWRANAGETELLATVRDLVDKSLLRAASFHHAQAQELERTGRAGGAVAEYGVAAATYADHRARFPRSRQAPELAFARADCLYHAGAFAEAARAYEALRDDPAGERYEADASLSAVLSWEREIARLRGAGALEERKPPASAGGGGEGVARAPIPEPLVRLVRASDVLLAHHPDHERAAPIAYRAAEVFHAHGDGDEARCRFDEIVARWPATEVARFAANLLIESLLATRDWVAMEEASARLQASPVGRDPALHAALQKFKLGGRFNRALQLMEAGHWEEAAGLFLGLVAEEPRHEFADKALYNAASCLERGRSYEGALRLYARVAAEYPRSSLADEALFRLGYDAENTYDFDRAVETYLALVDGYPGSTHRKDALYNAARALENLQRYDRAAAAYARYATLYPDAEDAGRTQFHAALVYGKMGDRRREIEALQVFVRRFARAREPELLVQAHLEIALAHRRLGEEDAARAGYRAAVAEFTRRGLDPERSPRAAAAAAEARFRLAEYDFERYDRITLPATTSSGRLRKALEAKLAEARKVAPQYDEVMRYRRPDWILAAFYRKAFLLERLAQTILDAPVPPEYARKGAEEYLAAYQDGLAQAAQPYEDQAVDVYVQAIEAARKLHVRNEWTRKIGESLARFRPKEYPILKEPRSRLLAEDLSPARFADTPDGPSRRALPPTPPRTPTP